MESIESDCEAEYKTDIEKIISQDTYRICARKPRPRDLIQ